MLVIAVCQTMPSLSVRRWAEAALLYVTETLDNQQLMTDMAAAMAASLAEVQGPPAPETLPSEQLMERYQASAVLHAVCGTP